MIDEDATFGGYTLQEVKDDFIMDKPDKPTYFAVQYDNEVYVVFDNEVEANEFKAGCYGLEERHIRVVEHTWGG